MSIPRHRITHSPLQAGLAGLAERLDRLSASGWIPFHIHEVNLNQAPTLLIISRKAPGQEPEPTQRIAAALAIAARHGLAAGAEHKAWVIDQMVRCLTGGDYAGFVPERWNQGVAPSEPP